MHLEQAERQTLPHPSAGSGQRGGAAPTVPRVDGFSTASLPFFLVYLVCQRSPGAAGRRLEGGAVLRCLVEVLD